MVQLKGVQDLPMYFGAPPEILRLSGDLRNDATEAECILWNRIRRKKISGYKFRRQHPIDRFVVDFFCYEALLAIEVDGGVHDEETQHERDEQRTLLLNRFDINVIRFTNDQVVNNINIVLNEIKDALLAHTKK